MTVGGRKETPETSGGSARSDASGFRGAWLPRISVGRPVTVAMVLSALVLLGGLALVKLPVQLYPSGYESSHLSVRIPYPGANPSEIEEHLVRPLEDAMYTVRGLKEISCTANTDRGSCWMEFQNYVDMDETYNAVADRIERLRATVWPDDVERVNIRRYDPNSEPVMKVAVAVPGDDDPYWLLQRRIVQRLERVDGVANVELEGVVERQILIEPDRVALESHSVSVRDLAMALGDANFALASGDVRDGGRKLLVRSVARFESVDAIRRIAIRADGLRLSDVASVRYAEPERDRESRLDGRPAALIEIFKESEANTVEVTGAVRRALDDVAEGEAWIGASGGLRVLQDQGSVIRQSIDRLRNTGLQGALLAIVILYVFLRRVRVTVLITLSIPISLMICLVVMYFVGASLNVLTMLGMLLCIGMLVDAAVVVTENIDRLRRGGSTVRDAALRGASDVALALTIATVTTIAVFVPAVLMGDPGMMTFMIRKLALPVMVAIGASLVVAMLFVPLAASVLLRSESERRDAGAGEGRAARMFGALYRATFDRLHRVYVVLLRASLAHRGIVVAVLAAIALATWYVPYKSTEVSVQVHGHQRGGRTVTVWFSLPNSYGMTQADDWFRKVEAAFEPGRERLGIEHFHTRFWRNRGMVQAILAEDTEVPTDVVVRGLQQVAPTAAGVRMYVNWQRGSGSDASMNVALYGEDTATLAELAEEAERRLRLIPGLDSVEPELEAALEEVRIRVDRDRASRYDIAPEVVSGTVATALRGRQVPRLRAGEREVEIRVRFPERDRRGVGSLGNLDVAAGDRRVPLEAVADVSVTRGFGDVHRRDRRTTLNIKLNTTRDKLGPLRARVTGVMQGLELPEGYSWDFGSQRRWSRQDTTSLTIGLLWGIVFVYLIMGFLFESALLPLSVIPSIALSWIGVFWMLYWTDTKLDTLAAIGLILLAGLVVNNGIVLVDLANRLRTAGVDRLEAIVEAGRLRFRPILMTALTTIFGMLPMAFDSATFVGMPYAGLGRAFVGGLLSSTVLTLVAVPVLYTLLDDAGAAFRSLLPRGREAAPAEKIASPAS